jgi:hypothetical protein
MSSVEWIEKATEACSPGKGRDALPGYIHEKVSLIQGTTGRDSIVEKSNLHPMSNLGGFAMVTGPGIY